MSPEKTNVWNFDAFQLDAGKRSLFRDGQPVSLTPATLDLLLQLVEKAGRLVTKAELMGKLWPDTPVSDEALPFTISVLRKALGENEQKRFIETVPRRGYRFVALPVESVAGKPSRPALELEPLSSRCGALDVFLCYAHEDRMRVRELYQRLRQDGVTPWLDEKNLLPGHDWEREIRTAVRRSDVVLVCLSRSSVSKSGFVQKEIRIALDVADEKPEGTIFIIPARLEDCAVPDRLQRWQWVDLPEQYEELVRALQARATTK